MNENENKPLPPAENPFQAPVDASLVDAQQQPVVSNVRPVPVRVWSAITVPFIGIITSLIVATIALFAAIFALGININPNDMGSLFEELFDHPLGIWVVVLPGQLGFLAAGVIAAMLSPVPTGKRLRMGIGKLPIWTWFVFLVATPCIGLVTALVIQLMDIAPSEHLKMMEQMMTAKNGLAFLVLTFLIAIVPGFVEELLFRGYMQARLLMKWPPIAAILLSSFVFAIAHVDPLHACAVFPIGIWFGLVAYRAGSIWPAVLCHFGNNFLSLTLSQFGFETIGFGATELAIFVPCTLAMLFSLFLLSKGTSDARVKTR